MFVIKDGTAPDKIGEGTTKETIDAITKHLEKNGMTVRTSDQDQSYLKANSQKFIDEAFGTRNAQLEKDILEITGIAKADSNEKYYDYFKRALKDFKTNVDEVGKLKGKIDELVKAGGNTKVVEELRQQLKDAQEMVRKNTEENEKKINEYKNQLTGTRVKQITDQALEKIKPSLKQFDATIMPDVIQSRLNKFSAEVEAVEVEGTIIYKNKKDGSTMLSKKDGKPMSAEEVLDPYFEDIKDKGRKAAGAGSKAGDGKGAEDKGKPAAWKELQIDKAVVNTKLKLGDYLVKEGKLAADSAEFTEAFTELSKDLPLR